jgi:hypothetical protein
VDVEKEQEITENLGSAHINTWRKLRLANPYRFHERQYTGNDKKFWTDSQRAMWDDYYDASEHMKRGFYVVPKSLNVEHFQQYVSKDFRFINEVLLKMDLYDLSPSQSLFSLGWSVSSVALSSSIMTLRSPSLG